MVARFTLRMLCNKDFTTRRPIGLTRAELAEQIFIQTQVKGQLPASKVEIETTLDRVLLRFMDAYIIILEDEDHFNLIHDYVTSAVRDATADVETVEEPATRLLEQYMAQGKLVRNVVLPLKTLRFIQRYANRETLSKSEAQALIRRSKLRYIGTAFAVVIGVLVLALLLLPFGLRYPVSEHIDLAGMKVLSPDGSTLVQQNPGQTSTSVFLLREHTFAPHKIDVNGDLVSISVHGKFIFFLDKDGGLYLVNTLAGFSCKKDHR